jgi:hypothetical protein
MKRVGRKCLVFAGRALTRPAEHNIGFNLTSSSQPFRPRSAKSPPARPIPTAQIDSVSYLCAVHSLCENFFVLLPCKQSSNYLTKCAAACPRTGGARAAINFPLLGRNCFVQCIIHRRCALHFMGLCFVINTLLCECNTP